MENFLNKDYTESYNRMITLTKIYDMTIRLPINVQKNGDLIKRGYIYTK